MDMGSFDWSHVAETFFGGLGALTTAFMAAWTIYARHRDAADKRAENERQKLIDAAEEAEKRQDERHAENQKVLNKITAVLRFVPPHRHREMSGNLTADGIDYGPEPSRYRDDL